MWVTIQENYYAKTVHLERKFCYFKKIMLTDFVP